MTTFQSHFQFGPLPDHKKQTYTGQALLDPLASDSEDLLPDLWLEPPKNPVPVSYSTWNEPNWQTLMMRDASLEYAQLLLPHSLLAPLTEENLERQDTRNREREPRSFRQEQVPSLLKESKSSSVKSDDRKSASPRQKHINTQLYKTELCVSYMKMGVCPYGNKCQFAHGQEDLKTVERPANWRLKPCANWAKYGLCRYGKRCCFKHGD
ncbi:hypothetical protein C7M61_000022 [Candidozyma pseudohaemuli]|uniref:C3H1-type domain-containing protein n=1 Tax=Candidozyma pseudohaemuli TaxID=418784 RepID=A0A2P7YWQ2_9ASCO|nr:hypothetical protein C7M61_000022 [[Candida] pseudohaemulonii]PSK40387.1 hypothetical protein C7M61_000022 [[Candida] pseudohaemulonii]